MSTWGAVERLAGRQYGVVARWQVLGLGVPTRTFTSAVRRLGWESVDPGIWAAPWSRPSFARRCMIARIGGPRGRILTGGAQFTLAGVRRLEPSRVDLLASPRLSVARRAGTYVYRGAWVAGDRVIRVAGMPCAPWLRAVTDAADCSSVDRLRRDLEALDRLRLVSLDVVPTYLSRRGRFPGRPKLVEALANPDIEVAHSRDEQMARERLRASGLAVHFRPLLVTARSRRVAEIDMGAALLKVRSRGGAGPR